MLVICIDTLRADQLGCFGGERPTSPTIDALAERGTLFERAQAQSSWTVPSTASLLTSLYPSEHGAGLTGDMRNLSQQSPHQMLHAVETLPEILHREGFRSGFFCANPYLGGSFTDGFDKAVVERLPAKELTDLALDWLDGQPRTGVFIYFQYMDLHQPIDAPGKYFNFFPVAGGGERTERHRNWAFDRGTGLDTAEFRRYRANRIALYDGALLSIDHQIARILDRLRERGTLKDTLVVITSDHGEEFWDHARLEATLGGDPRGYYGVGHGQSMFQELLHVPLILAGPGIEMGVRVSRRVELLDVAPTVLAVLGEPVPAVMRGRQLCAGDHQGRRADHELRPVLAESPAYGPDSQALILGDWKLISRVDGVKLLYDLRTDPREHEDLASRMPHKVEVLSQLLHALRDELQRPEDSPVMTFDSETTEQLRTLGYVN